MATTVSYNDLKALVGNSQNLILIDVRSEGEAASLGRIPGSINIPVNMVESALRMTPDDFMAEYKVNKPALDAPELVFYCQSGRRGVMAMNKARQLGYQNARNYSGGYGEWSTRERK